ncbi:AGAP012210-PA, partial [Anopheles gambiae str. PEST]
MKRRWSNNGGFTALRMLDESSSEVTSSSAALVMSPNMTMSPTSLGSPEYNDLELWGAYDENAYNGHSVLVCVVVLSIRRSFYNHPTPPPSPPAPHVTKRAIPRARIPPQSA